MHSDADKPQYSGTYEGKRDLVCFFYWSLEHAAVLQAGEMVISSEGLELMLNMYIVIVDNQRKKTSRLISMLLDIIHPLHVLMLDTLTFMTY